MNMESQSMYIKLAQGVRHAVVIGLGLLLLAPTNLIADDQDTGQSASETAPPAKTQRPAQPTQPSTPPPIDLPAESELTFPTDI